MVGGMGDGWMDGWIGSWVGEREKSDNNVFSMDDDGIGLDRSEVNEDKQDE